MMIIVRFVPALLIHIDGMIAFARLNFYLEQGLAIRALDLCSSIIPIDVIGIIDALIYTWRNFSFVYLPVRILVIAIAVIIGIHIPVIVILVVCMPLIVGLCPPGLTWICIFFLKRLLNLGRWLIPVAILCKCCAAKK